MKLCCHSVIFFCSGGYGGRGGHGGGGRDFGGYGSRGGSYGGGKFDFGGKGLRKPRWNLEELPAFEKNFYREHINVQNRTAEEIDEYRAKREITVAGRNVARPVTSFVEAGFPGKLCGCLATFLPRLIQILKSTRIWEQDSLCMHKIMSVSKT